MIIIMTLMLMFKVVSCSQTRPTTKKGSAQPTVLAFVKSIK